MILKYDFSDNRSPESVNVEADTNTLNNEQYSFIKQLNTRK